MTDDVTRAAIEAIARTAEGRILYRYLQNELCSICHDLVEGALRRHEGRRIFASDLMALMAEGMDASGGRDDTVIPSRRDAGEQPKRKLSIREYLAGQPSWHDDVAGTNLDDKPASTT